MVHLLCEFRVSMSSKVLLHRLQMYGLGLLFGHVIDTARPMNHECSNRGIKIRINSTVQTGLSLVCFCPPLGILTLL